MVEAVQWYVESCDRGGLWSSHVSHGVIVDLSEDLVRSLAAALWTIYRQSKDDLLRQRKLQWSGRDESMRNHFHFTLRHNIFTTGKMMKSALNEMANMLFQAQIFLSGETEHFLFLWEQSYQGHRSELQFLLSSSSLGHGCSFQGWIICLYSGV